ncbi:MAG TPA: CoA transferase [Pseudonocardiaceae bacterium]|nr:CoA transferase [Pseudonocardiaceae bacterium]
MTAGPLAGRSIAVPGDGAAAWHAQRMLGWLGAGVEADATNTATASDWARSGLVGLTGRRDGPPLLPPGQAASAVRGALLAIRLLTSARSGLPGVELLSRRARILGLRRDAPRSARGAFQVLRAADGWLGVNLPRPSDQDLLEPWLGQASPDLADAVAHRRAGELADRARLFGLAVAALPDDPAQPDEQLIARSQDAAVRPFVLTGRPADRPRKLVDPLVVDLSSLWAGPLCAHLLSLLGARVVKVESTQRPDGARAGSPGFYRELHAGHREVTLDFTAPTGRAELAGLIESADVVIEASRPRALRQLGIDAEEILARSRDKVWLSITAYGRTGPWANAIGFGDDTAMAAGLLAFDPATGTPAPCGDAIADPVTGVNAALVAVACLQAGGPWLADLALREQIAATLDQPATAAPHTLDRIWHAS